MNRELINDNERLVKYNTRFNIPASVKPKSISSDDIDDYDFTKGFTEFFINVDNVHLYFDFDQIKTQDDLIDLFDWLYKLEEVFGEFTYGGYSNDQEIANDYELRYIENDEHYVSMHVIYHTTCISSND